MRFFLDLPPWALAVLVFVGLKAIDFGLPIMANTATPKVVGGIQAVAKGGAAYRTASRIYSIETGRARPEYVLGNALTMLFLHIGGMAACLCIFIVALGVSVRHLDKLGSADLSVIGSLGGLIALPFLLPLFRSWLE